MSSHITYIYHITHLNNLPSILAANSLLCHHALTEQGIHGVNITHQGIQNRRALKRVPCGPGESLHHYVPFYFAPRSPMLYAIHRGYVESYIGNQTEIVHIVSSIEKVQTTNHQFVFTDGHAVMDLSNFFTDLVDLDKIDWPLMQEKMWNDTPNDNDRTRRRNAEFLVYNQFSWNAILGIGVHSQEIASNITHLLTKAGKETAVRVHPHWYYE